MKLSLDFYPKETLHTLEFDKILQLIENNCISSLGINALHYQGFSNILDEINFNLKQVDEMKSAFENGHHFPAQNYFDLTEELKALSIINNVLDGKQFRKILLCALTIEDIENFFKKNKEEFLTLRKNISLIQSDKKIIQLIERIIDENGTVRSDASPTLVKIRNEINSKAKAIHIVFGRILGKLKEGNHLSETEESIRNGRRVLALQSESKRSIQGIIHDESDSGKTTYLEPQETVLLNNELFELERDEKREIHKILLELSKQIAEKSGTIKQYQQVLASYDLIRAKALFALAIDAKRPIVSEISQLHYKEAYHPLLYLKNKSVNKKTIAFDVNLQKNKSILLISGPNAGGKSVTLKTIGLLQLMLQYSLLIPCNELSKVGLFEHVFTDLGDKQSIEDELSTYSSHLLLMKNFMHHANAKTLILIDEFGTGTDPRFGAAMAEAIMLKIAQKKSFGVITTHYSNLKKVAEQNEQFLNAAMVFNEQNLSPTYQLQTGTPGSSFTFAIAEKIGLQKELIEDAKSKVDYSDLKFEELIEKVEGERKRLAKENQNIKKENQRLKELANKFEQANLQMQHRQQELRQQIVLIEKQKNEAIEHSINDVLREINNAKSKEIAAQKAKEFTALKQEIIEKKQARVPIPKNIQTEQINAGDMVLLEETDREGEVLEIRGNEAVVNFNGLKTTIKLKKLQKLHLNKAPEKIYRKYQALKEVENEFDIRGLQYEEARPLIEQYFDQALYNNLQTIKIIHGKGMGVLRKQLQQLIKEYKSSILEWKYEEENRGGNGATIITFK